MEKINRKKPLIVSSWVLVIGFWILVLFLLIYTRIYNLGWGLPFPMHPDERNMATAIQNLNCRISNLSECFNPRFFAYGQFPLYLGYFIIMLLKFFDGDLIFPISYSEAAISLRIISSVSSILSVFVMYRLAKILIPQNLINKLYSRITLFLFFIFSPALVQFSHFGTTESLLTLYYLSVVLISLYFLENKLSLRKFILIIGIICGLSLATKVSSFIYLSIPAFALYTNIIQTTDKYKWKFISLLKNWLGILVVSLSLFVLFSPHNLINYSDFVDSIKYESAVATGAMVVFYTQQFVNTLPLFFQATRIFPFALGWPIFVLSILGFLYSTRDFIKSKAYRLILISILIYAIPNSFLFAKWTRFMMPVFPLFIIFAGIFLIKIKLNRFLKWLFIFIAIIPGLAYLSVYYQNDIRLQASEWIYKNVPENSLILSETANVVDIPLPITKIKPLNYQVISFNFYNLEQEQNLVAELNYLLKKADYIFVPSRRIFANYSCYHPEKKNWLSDKACNLVKSQFPNLSDYYRRLFSGESNFHLVAKFESFPKISFLSQELYKLPDEEAEETWTVFDHPVIRIYKKF